MTVSGRLYTVGVGPGDPELISVKAARLIARVPVVAYMAKHDRVGHAYAIARSYIDPAAELLRLDYPFTTEIGWDTGRYQDAMACFYDSAADTLADRLARGLDVALLCEGDPFFYGSSMYVFDRVTARGHSVETIPGIMGMSGCWARAGVPMLHGDDVLSVLPATLPRDDLARRLGACDAAVIMKLGGNLPGVRHALDAACLTERAIYIEYGTMQNERIMPFAAMQRERAPYFSLVLVPGRAGAR